jgi:cobalt-zinc-cadmium resistance protein CzcA
LISERLATVELPAGIERPKMGPVSTGLGEVFHYIVRLQDVDISNLPRARQIEELTQLRTVHDWVVKPQLRTVKGTAEVNSWGGFEKQYQIRITPTLLSKHGLTFDEVVNAVRSNNRNVGGGNITRNTEMLLVHGIARTVNIEQIENIVIKAIDGSPIRVSDVANVEIGHEIRRGAVTADGQGEVVYGLGFMLMGENSHKVTYSLKDKMAEIKDTLPAGVEVEIGILSRSKIEYEKVRG